MYELIDINPKLTTEFYKAMKQAYSKDNRYDIISEAMKQAHKSLEPQIPESILEAMINELVDPLKEKDNNTLTRDFENEDEAIEAYENTYNDFIKELEYSKDVTDQYNLRTGVR